MPPLLFYAYMHDVVPSVVAIAVRMVMAMCSTFSQKVFVAMSRLVFKLMFSFFLGTDFADFFGQSPQQHVTDFHILMYTYRSDYLDDTEN